MNKYIGAIQLLSELVEPELVRNMLKSLLTYYLMDITLDDVQYFDQTIYYEANSWEYYIDHDSIWTLTTYDPQGNSLEVTFDDKDKLIEHLIEKDLANPEKWINTEESL